MDNNKYLGELTVSEKCNKCNGDRYLLIDCCSGMECGCRGLPVQITNCKTCNIEGSAEMGEGLKRHEGMLEYLPYIKS